MKLHRLQKTEVIANAVKTHFLQIKLPEAVQKHYIHGVHSSTVAEQLFSQLTDHRVAWFDSAKATNIRTISHNRNTVMTRQNYTANKMITSLSKCTFFPLQQQQKRTNTKIKHMYYGLKEVKEEGNSESV